MMIELDNGLTIKRKVVREQEYPCSLKLLLYILLINNRENMT